MAPDMTPTVFRRTAHASEPTASLQELSVLELERPRTIHKSDYLGRAWGPKQDCAFAQGHPHQRP
eukprot:9346684-Alexandrium_andersonii.AAC.1